MFMWSFGPLAVAWAAQSVHASCGAGAGACNACLGGICASCETALESCSGLFWVAVKELNLHYHNRDV